MGPSGWLKTFWRDRRNDASDRTRAEPARAIPFHVAIIMDGNGRWARRRGLPVNAGHRAGIRAVRSVIEAARDFGIGQLTLYSFSTENWSRPSEEVEGLMSLHAEMIDAEVPTLHENDCRVVFVGLREGLSEKLLEKMEWAETLTAGNKRMVLFIAFNYGGRREIVEAIRHAVAAGADPLTLTEADVSRHLYSPLMRDVDLCIRTSGERRLSNFLMWQSAYAELLFSDKLWPDFGRHDLAQALADFEGRERRFGARQGGPHA